MQSRLLFLIAAAICMLMLGAANSSAQSLRMLVANCYRQGAWNEHLMHSCSGRWVSAPQFHSCMRGGSCLGEPPVARVQTGQPFCGAMGLPFCMQPQRCNRIGGARTIACPNMRGAVFACGARGFPPCIDPQPCGMHGTFPCIVARSWPPQKLPMPPFIYDEFSPEIEVVLPSGFGSAGRPSIEYVQPALPDLRQLDACRRTARKEQDFFRCTVERALPREYRIARDCMIRHDDPGEALLCSSGNRNALRNYQRFREVQECARRADDDRYQAASCLGKQFLGKNERYYMGCVTDNSDDLKAAAVCAVAKDLTPEQQIALSCAISTGGNPKAFAICAGTRLAARELKKCWQHGVGTDRGCFGPNNEIRHAAERARTEVCNATGRNSAACQIYSAWHNNVLMPGPNHDVVRHLNNGLKDLREGPGENNELVRLHRDVQGAVKSIGHRLRF